MKPHFYRNTFGAILIGMALVTPMAHAEETITSHGISAYGDLKYPSDFKHFDYVNPNAPQGGTLTMLPRFGGATFDSFNRYILKGAPATATQLLNGALLAPSEDEADSYYGYIAKTLEYPKDRSWVRFNMRKEATFADGVPITAHDVVFSFNTLIEKGHPFYKTVIYKDVASVTAEDDHTVMFKFKDGANTRDLPTTVGAMPIFATHYWKENDFSESSLDVPVGSGEYTITDFVAGQYVKYCKIDNYWAKDHPINVGTGNFDCLKYEYFKDGDVAFEAFKSAQYLFREEYKSKRWKTQYDFPAFEKEWVKTDLLPDSNPQSNQGIWINLRRDKFKNVKTREALQYLFNFEWTNKTVFFGAYERSDSFWENTPMQADGMISEAELALLEPFRDQLPARVFDEPAYVPPVLKDDKFDRRALRKANKLLAEAGWVLDNGVLKDSNGEPLTIEIIDDNDDSLHILTPFIDNLLRAGIDAKFVQVDRAQLIERRKTYDFDVMQVGYVVNLSPSENIAQLYGSVSANQEDGANMSGVAIPAVDELIKKVGAAQSREEMQVAIRAIDRILRAEHIRIPNWFLAQDRVAYWDVFGRPEIKPEYGQGVISTWWFDQDKYDALVAQGALK